MVTGSQGTIGTLGTHSPTTGVRREKLKGLFAPFLASQAHLSRSKNRKRSYPGRAPQQQQSTTKIQPHGISFSPENQHVPKLKEKPPPPRPTVQAERNGDEGGSVASDRWPKALPEINTENFAQPTPNFLYSWKWLIPKTLDGTSSPLPRCKGAQQVQCPHDIYKNKVLGAIQGKNPGEMGLRAVALCPHFPVHVGTAAGPGIILGVGGSGTEETRGSAWDGLFEQTKSSGLFPPAPTQWKEFPTPAPGWKS